MSIMTVNVLQDRFATVAEINYKGKRVTGSAKRAKGDKHNSQVGEELAVARALENLARHLDAKAWRKINKDNAEPAQNPVQFLSNWSNWADWWKDFQRGAL